MIFNCIVGGVIGALCGIIIRQRRALDCYEELINYLAESIRKNL